MDIALGCFIFAGAGALYCIGFLHGYTRATKQYCE